MYRREFDKKLIGANLRRCREDKNLSVEYVREYLCIGSQQAIYKWEEGKNLPQTDTMLALMELYGVGLIDLLYQPAGEKMALLIRGAGLPFTYGVTDPIGVEDKSAGRGEKYYNFFNNTCRGQSSGAVHAAG